MRAHILRRLLISIPLVFLMTFLVFAVINLNPEASIQRYILQPNVSFQFIEQEKERLGLYDPLPIRYLRWLGGVLGDLQFGRESRSLISFADAATLRSTFELRSSWAVPLGDTRLETTGDTLNLAERLDPAARYMDGLSIEAVNRGTSPARLVLTASRTGPADAPPATWTQDVEALPGESVSLTFHPSRRTGFRAPATTLHRLTLTLASGSQVDIQSATVTTAAEVVRPSRGRPFAVLPLLGAGHTHTFHRLGSPYTRLILPRSDWAPAGKVVAVEDVEGEPTEIVETRGFRALRLEVGNPLSHEQQVELVLVSGPDKPYTKTILPFTVASRRRETIEFPLSTLVRRGVDLEHVHRLSIRAKETGLVYLSRTLLVVDEPLFRVGGVPNFGTSYENNIPVLRRLGGRVRNTILLVIASMLLTWAVALPFGIIAAVRQYSATDRLLSFLSFIGMALPGFFLAILVRYLASLAADPESFFFFLPALPTSGRVSADHDSLSALGRALDLVRHAILPVLVLGMGGMAGMQRVMRGTLLEVQRQPFITTARAKGLSERVVIYKHALRNAITPFIAGFGSILPALIGGSALIEIVFNYPGVGQLMLPAVLNRDINLVMGNTFIAALLLVAGNLIADILLAVVDPRVSYD